MNGSNEKCAWISILICTPTVYSHAACAEKKKERKKMHNFPGASVVARSF